MWGSRVADALGVAGLCGISVGGWEPETAIRSWQVCSAHHWMCVSLSASLLPAVVVVTWPHVRDVFRAAGQAAPPVYPPLYKAAFFEPALCFLSHAKPVFTD